MNRRSILKAIGIAPAAASALAHQVNAGAVSALTAEGSSIPRSGGIAAGSIGNASLKFKDVASWWSEIGDKDARDNARYVSQIDPDIIDMRLPSATKVRLQRERNYERRKQSMLAHMAKKLSLKGFIEDWP